jgi:hypothetical protein
MNESMDITKIKLTLDSLPDVSTGRQKITWTDDEVKLLMEYWPIKNQIQVAKILGRAAGTCREKYREELEKNR